MKIYQHIIPAILLSACSLPTFADGTYRSYSDGPNPASKDYITLTGSLGYRYSDGIKDDDGKDVDISSDFSQSLALGWAYERNSEGELLFSNSKHSLVVETDSGSDVDLDLYIQYLHIGGRVLFTNNSPFSTSIGLGIGGTYINPSNGYDSELKFSGNISGGIRYQLSDQFALRGDLRVFGTVLSSDNKYICQNGDCLINLNNNMYVQTELMAGIEYKF